MAKEVKGLYADQSGELAAGLSNLSPRGRRAGLRSQMVTNRFTQTGVWLISLNSFKRQS